MTKADLFVQVEVKLGPAAAGALKEGLWADKTDQAEMSRYPLDERQGLIPRLPAPVSPTEIL
jgi:hypothetical protein